MKTKKSAVSAALKPTDTKTTSAAPKATVAAPKTVASASSVASAASAAPKAAKAPVSRKPAAIETALAPIAPAAAKSTTAAKPAPAPKPAAASPKSTTTTTTTTTIEVKIDVGYGNAVYLRGQGSGLNWERGVPLSCVDGATWRWSQPVSTPVTFKVLLNDQVWSTGGDLVVEPGQKLEVSPSFS